MHEDLSMNLFRFRRHAGKILKIYACLVQSDVRGLHPMQISRLTGLSFHEVARRLDATPELFVRLVVASGQPRRYALNTRARAMTAKEVERFVQRGIMRESLILYSLVVMILLALITVLLSSIPLYQAGFGASK